MARNTSGHKQPMSGHKEHMSGHKQHMFSHNQHMSGHIAGFMVCPDISHLRLGRIRYGQTYGMWPDIYK
eukprot:5305556-Lingulodinium_polyedra.AAC.1